MLLPPELPGASSSPCAQCPWRTTNHGRRHPGGWYSAANRRRLWAGLRRGVQMTCHPTDVTNPLPLGVRAVPEGTEVRLCAGALALQQRELNRLQDVLADGGDWSAYVAAAPRPALSASGAAELVWLAAFGQLPAVDLDADVGR